MTTQTDIQWIPLKDLARSDSNVRATPASADAMRELEASIDAHGLIENLVVRPTPNAGKPYRVTAGERRLEALQNLARKRKSAISPTTPIPCRVLGPDDVDEEVSLAENVMRVAMHPVDQYAAFRKLLDRGLDARAIANRFGLTARTVQRRLRLGDVAPEILAEAKEDRLSLEQLEAFASTPDRARQVEVWTKMRNQRAYTPAAGWIRNELQRQLLSAASPRVLFVGLKAYRDAGGTSRRTCSPPRTRAGSTSATSASWTSSRRRSSKPRSGSSAADGGGSTPGSRPTGTSPGSSAA